MPPKVLNQNLGFSEGFGPHHQLPVFSGEGPKTGVLLADDSCSEINTWVHDQDDNRLITEIVPADQLSHALINRLLHEDTVTLVQLLPKLLMAMPVEERAILISAIESLPHSLLGEINEARMTFVTHDPYFYFLGLAAPQLESKIYSYKAHDGDDKGPVQQDILVNNVSMEVFASVFPVLFISMDDAQKEKMTEAFVHALHNIGKDKEFFAPLSNVKVNQLIVEELKAGVGHSIVNHGRMLGFHGDGAESPVHFQGEVFLPQSLYFRRLQNTNGMPVQQHDGKTKDHCPDFMRYRDSEQQREFKRRRIDSIPDVVGQVSVVSMSEDDRALMINADVKLGEENAEIARYLAFLNEHHSRAALAENQPVMAQNMAFNPLAALGEQLSNPDVSCSEVPFFSLRHGGLSGRLNNDQSCEVSPGKLTNGTLYRGVRVVHLPQVITISEEQLTELEALQPTIREINEAASIRPLARLQPAQKFQQTAPNHRDPHDTEPAKPRTL